MAAPNKAVGPKSDKEWREALRLALHEEYDDIKSPGAKSKALRLIARSVVEKAIEGDMAAAKEIGDRLDGKPAQSVSVGGDAENPIVVADITPLETARRIAYLLASGLQNVEEPTNG